ncbi:MAG: sensor domain-containing diguanylate cyclase [Magnetococcales bacterium]|nr:sensor domain-containing diguanylate cyclase [Magnetococcales bacterium]
MARDIPFNYDAMVEQLADGVYFVDRERRILYWNDAAERIAGYSRKEMIGSRCADNILVHVNESGRNLCDSGCPLSFCLEREEACHDYDVFLHHKLGHRVPVHVRATPLRDDSGKIIGAAEVFTDRSSQELVAQRVEELEKLAFLDALTRIANRRFLEYELHSRLEEWQRMKLPFGVLMMDVDHFKRFNDTHGHALGDRVLQMVAATLQAVGRPFDIYGRWGGEEFLGLIKNVNSATLLRIGERCRSQVASAFLQENGQLLQVTLSLGAALAVGDDTAETILQRADRFLYRSKAEGRNRISGE